MHLRPHPLSQQPVVHPSAQDPAAHLQPLHLQSSPVTTKNMIMIITISYLVYHIYMLVRCSNVHAVGCGNAGHILMRYIF